MPSLEMLANYAAANASTDRELLGACMEAAQRWLEGAGVVRREGDALYDLACYMLATHYFDNRGVVQDGSGGEIPMGVMSIMHQLRLDDTAAATDGDGSAGSGEAGDGV